MVHWHTELVAAGRVVGGRYRIVRPLGRGGMARTLLVHDLLLGRELALKLLDLEGASALELFRDEFALLSGTYHPRLLEVVDFGSELHERGVQHFYSAVHVPGTTLDRFAIARRWPELERPLRDALHALAFLHGLGIRHGDFKPENVIVGPGGRATLIDLGCAAPLDAKGPAPLSGTPAYMAPELLADAAADARADLYSVGVVLDELARRMSGELPDRARRLTARLMARDPAARPSEVAEVLELLGAHEPIRDMARGRAPKLVGRAAEMERFERALARLRAAEPHERVLWLHGPPGIGKSRLLAQMKWAAQLAVRVVAGLASMPDAVRSLLGRASELDPLPTGLRAVIESHDRLVARAEPIVLVLDGADLLEDSERALLTALVRAIRPVDPLLLLCAGRERCPVEAEALGSVGLGPLAPSELRAWAAPWVAAGRVGALADRTGGIPARVESTLGELAAGRLLETELGAPDDGWAQGARQHGATDPGLALQLASLGDRERRALGRCLALGSDMARSGLLETAEPTAFAVLCAQGLVRREATRWVLGSAVDPDALAAALGPALLRESHYDVARALLDELPASADDDSSERAALALSHLGAAERWDEAEAELLDAARGAERRPLAWSRAAAPLGVRSTRDDVLLRLARLHQLAERSTAGLEVLARLVRRAPARRFDPFVCYVAAACLQSLGRAPRALRYLDRALASIDRAADLAWMPRSELGACLVDLRVRVLLRRGDYARAFELAERALDAADVHPSSAGLRQSLGLAASYLGNVSLARQELERAAELYGQSGALPDRIRALSYLAILEFRQGELARAIELYQAAVVLAEQGDLAPLLATALLNLGTACQRHGDWGAALDHYERAHRLAHLLGRVSTEATIGVNLANLHVELGSFDRGLARLDETEQAVEAAGLTHLRGTLHVIRGEVAEARGDFAGARAHFAQARRIHRERDATREAVEVDLHLGDVALAGGELAAALGLARDAAAQATALGATDLLAQAALLDGRCRSASGEPAAALPSLERAIELCRGSGQELLAAEVHAALETARRALGHDEPAREHRVAAQRILRRVAEALPAPLRSAYWAHPRRAELAPDSGAPLSPPLAPTRHETPERRALLRFLEVNQRINSSLSVAEVLEFAMDAAIELAGADRGFVLLRRAPSEGAGSPAPSADVRARRPSVRRAARAATPRDDVAPPAAEADRRPDYDVAVARNLDPARVGREHFEFSRSIAERVLGGEGPVVTVDAQRDERFARHRSVHAMALQSVACVPIRSPAGVIGALYLDNRFERGRFGTSDVDLLEAFANQVAIALENARMHAELEHRSAELAIEKQAVERLSRGQAREIERLQQEVVARQQALELRYSYDQIVGRSAPMRALLARLDRIIDTPVTVLIEGESGTGKELVARAVHFNSARRERPFVSVNCAALPEPLLESELFGHLRGSFTGASDDKPGLMVTASGGTLFLDEVGETPLGVQVKLLRALQERVVRPVGAMREVPIDVRVLAATNKDLLSEVAKGTFREDLYYRLGVVVVALPPLRERAEDIAALAKAFLARLAEREGLAAPVVSPAALRMLCGYGWPGNVRQLENVLAKAYYLSGRERIEASDIELPSARSAPRHARDRRQYEEQESQRILDALHRCRWNVSTVARELGIPRNTLYRKLERYRIERP